MNFRLFISTAIVLSVLLFALAARRGELSADEPVAQAIAIAASPAYSDVAPLIARYCGECHSGEKPRGDVNLQFKDESEVRQRSADSEFWTRVVDELTSKEM